MANRFVVDFIDVLQDGKCADFTDNSCELPIDVLGIIADEEELVAKQGEVGLEAFAHLSEHNGERPGSLLVGARRGLGVDVTISNRSSCTSVLRYPLSPTMIGK